MIAPSILSFPQGALLRPHSHKQAQICFLLAGSLKIYSPRKDGGIEVHHHNPGHLWHVAPNEIHSVAVIKASKLRRWRYSAPSITSIKSLSYASLAMLAICAARASASEVLCNYDLAQFERDQASGLRIDVPDCFFDSLESAAAGGDPQAAVELGISLLEGYSDEPGAKTLGSYWLKEAMRQGHPSAGDILDAYMEEHSC